MENNITDIDIEYFKRYVNSGNGDLVFIKKSTTISIFLLLPMIGMFFSFFWFDSVALRIAFIAIMVCGIISAIVSDKWFPGNRSYLFLAWLVVAGIGAIFFSVSIVLAYGVLNILILVFIAVHVIISVLTLRRIVNRISNRHISKEVYIMNLLRNEKKCVIRPFQLTAILIVIVCLSACTAPQSSTIIPSGSEIAWTKEELSEVYWEYKEELNEVAEIALACDTLRQKIIDNHEDWEICYTSQSSWFSEDDWDKIVDLFEKIRPYMMMRSLREGDDVVWFDFSYRKVKGGYLVCSLYYFKNPETAEAYKGYLHVGEGLEHFDGYWYINERFIETSLIMP